MSGGVGRRHPLEHRVPPVVVWLACLGSSWTLGRAGGPDWPVKRERRTLAALLVAFGLAVGGAGVLSFRRSGTTLDPLAPGEASSLVTGGVYAFTRNPMYLALASALLAFVVGVGRPPGLLGVPVFVAFLTRFQIIPEERLLRERFGAKYEVYARRVRRWL